MSDLASTEAVTEAAPRSRSSKGCWTCRLRRKKCDESWPACKRCQKLSLPCDGYGMRPAWMDGGVLERERATMTQEMVRLMSCKSRLKPRQKAPRGSGTRPAGGLYTPPTPEQLGNTSNLNGLDWTATRSDLASPDLNWQLDPLEFDIAVLDTADALGQVSSSSEESLPGLPSPLTHQDPGYFTTPNGIRPMNDFQNAPTVALVSHHDLFVEYFANVESLQYPCPTRGCRGWQYSLVMRSKMAYSTTIYLSATYLDRGKPCCFRRSPPYS